MSTLKTDAIEAATGTNTDLELSGKGTGVPDIAAGFKVGGSAGVPTASIQDDAITSAKIADDAVVTAAIADDAITAALMADDAVGVAQLSATGTASSSVFLRGDNAWAAAGGGAWNFMSTVNVTGDVTSMDITGLDSTYATYAIAFSGLKFDASANTLFRLGTSGGLITSGYKVNSYFTAGAATSMSIQTFTSTTSIRIDSSTNIGNGDANSALSGMYFLDRGTTSAGSYPSLWGQCHMIQDGGDSCCINVAGTTAANADIDRFSMLPSSGNIEAGRMTLWGIAHA